MTRILHVDKLNKHFVIDTQGFRKPKIIHAVKDVSFDVFEGESLGLIGESGCGKTTTANLVLRLLKPNKGKIMLFDDKITYLDEKEMRKFRKDIQIIFQHSNAVLDPQMTVEELLQEPLLIHHIVKDNELNDEVDRLLKMVGIPPIEKKKFPTQMSGGQKQRIIIARAIAVRPKLIVCDEPVSALDVSVQGQILNLLISLKKKLNLTYLFISHDLKVVKFVCERIAVMYKGEIIEKGDTDNVLTNPKHAHTKALVNALL